MMMSPTYLAAQQKASRQYDAAFHLFKVTFPLVKDPKLLIGVLHNLFSSLESSMDAILAYERELCLIPPYGNDFQSKFNLFRLKSVRRHTVPGHLVLLIANLKETLELHKKSPMEFQRGNKVVICDKNYLLKTISMKDIDTYLSQTKDFLAIMEHVIKFR